MSNIEFKHLRYRPDIDDLRAIAILSVVIFHAFPNLMPGGFVGVDVFFVISGFLISTIIYGNLEGGSFSFIEFYSRRIRRIFPALIVVLVFSMICGWFVLLSNEFSQLGMHILGGTGFVSNFILWEESGYFDSAAETKPLLHLWSLAIEEQFYIFYPLLLWLFWRIRFGVFITILAVTITSFYLNIINYEQAVAVSFYSPLTRMWELLVGSVLAYLAIWNGLKGSGFAWEGKGYFSNISPLFHKNHKNIQSFLGFILIVGGFSFISKESDFPGWLALLPTIGAMLIISAGPKAWINNFILSHPLLRWVGIISYPLYLWHWVLLCFARINEGVTPSYEVRGAIILLSFVMAWLTYVLVERPIRFGSRNKIKTKILVISMIAVGVGGWSIALLDGFPLRGNEVKYKEISKQFGAWDFKKNDLCENVFGKEHVTFCVSNSSTPEVVLFGDSHANHLYPGLVNAYDNNKGILSLGNGPSLAGVVYKFQKHTDHPWQQGYESYHRVMPEILRNKDLQTVVVAAHWEAVIHREFVLEAHKERVGNLYIELKDEAQELSAIEIFDRGFESTIRTLVSSGKNVIVSIDTPEIMKDPRVCLRNLESPELCSFSRDDVYKRQEYFRNYIEKIKKAYPSIKVFDPVPLVCPEEVCLIHDGGQLIYRDLSHISELTSRKIGKELRVLIDSFD